MLSLNVLPFCSLNSSYCCTDPGFCHKRRFCRISWSLHSLICNCHFSIFRLKWSTFSFFFLFLNKDACCLGFSFSTLSTDTPSASDEAEAAVAEAGDDDAGADDEVEGGDGGEEQLSLSQPAVTLPHSPPRESFPPRLAHHPSGKREARLSFIISIFIILKPPSTLRATFEFPMRLSYGEMQEILKCNQVILILFFTDILNMYHFYCTIYEAIYVITVYFTHCALSLYLFSAPGIF